MRNSLLHDWDFALESCPLTPSEQPHKKTLKLEDDIDRHPCEVSAASDKGLLSSFEHKRVSLERCANVPSSTARPLIGLLIAFERN
jgi:hypothetical protein